MPSADPPPAGFLAANPRLYTQLRPGPASLAHLAAVQRELAGESAAPDAGRTGPRWVPVDQLHLTLIHFGKVLDVYAVLTTATGVGWPDYGRLLEAYIRDTEALLPAAWFRLEPLALARFGRHGRTLVAEYRPDPALAAVHARAYAALTEFLRGCGISDPAAFTAQDPNFMFAAGLRPHITLCRNFEGTVPGTDVLPLLPVMVRPLPVLYPPKE